MSLLVRSRQEGFLHVEEKFTFEKDHFELKVDFEPGFTYEDFTKAVDLLKKETEDNWYDYLYPVCYYSEPSPVFYRNKTHIKEEFQCKFFYANGKLAYTPTGRSGWYIEDMSYRKIKTIIVRHKQHPDILAEKEKEREKLWNRIQKARFDEQTWSHLKKDDFREDKHPFFYIKKVFNEWDMRRIREGFEQKKDFRIRVEATNRDYTAEGKMGDDGIYRAWFSSEFSGWANGDYYYLLNPTTAVFCEHD